MELREVTVAELGERAELSPNRIELLLEAKEEAGALEVMRLAAALEAEPGDLFDGLHWVANSRGGGEYRYDESRSE
jgi:hypothetical protein